jgi:hypothetical protein
MTHARPINTKGEAPRITWVYSNSHKGIDYGYVAGTPIYATQSGKITVAIGTETRQWIANTSTDPYRTSGTRVLRNEDYGNRIQIDHGSGHMSLYAHLRHGSLRVKVGDNVAKGQQIAEVGSTGNSTGNHLHYELRINGVNVNLANHFDSTFNNYFTGSGGQQDMMQISKADFEKLHANSLIYDEYQKIFQSPPQALQLLEKLKADNKAAQDARKQADTRAEEIKKENEAVRAELSKMLDVRQDWISVRTEIESVLKRMDEAEEYRSKHSDDSRKWAEQELTLKSEIARLQALLDQQNVLENVSDREIIVEIIRRLKSILLKGGE